MSVISESVKKDLLRHVKVEPRKVRVVHDPVSTDFQPVAREFNAAKPFVLQVGTGSNKNVERVAQALQGIPCHLRIIGNLDEEQLKVLRQCGAEYSSVSNISDTQVVDEYRQCDMLVFASTYEGFGLPIVEAQATGRPVVTSNILSMPEVGGDAACLVDAFDVASIRDGILKVINNSTYREELVRLGVREYRAIPAGEDRARIYGYLQRTTIMLKLEYEICKCFNQILCQKINHRALCHRCFSK